MYMTKKKYFIHHHNKIIHGNKKKTHKSIHMNMVKTKHYHNKLITCFKILTDISQIFTQQQAQVSCMCF